MNLPNTRNNTHHTAKAKSPLRLVKTKDLSRDEWLEARRSGLGSSDAATALGLNPYQSRLALWIEKTRPEQSCQRQFKFDPFGYSFGNPNLTPSG